MPSKMFISLSEAATRLGKTEEETQRIVKQHGLRDFRNGPEIHFLAEPFERLAQELVGASAPTATPAIPPISPARHTPANPPPQPQQRPTAPEEDRSEPEQLMNGLNRDSVTFLLNELLAAPLNFGAAATERAEAAIPIFAGQAPRESSDREWAKACTTIADRLPSIIARGFAKMIAGGWAEESTDKVLNCCEPAVRAVAQAWRAHTDLTREAAESVARAAGVAAIVLRLATLLKLAEQEYVKNLFEPGRQVDLIGQLMEGLTNPGRALREFGAALESDARVERLTRIMADLQRASCLS